MKVPSAGARIRFLKGGVAKWFKAAVCKTAMPPAQVPNSTSTYDDSPERLAALLGAFAAEIGPKAPDLAAVVSAWPGLPEALRAGIVAMVKAAGETAAK